MTEFSCVRMVPSSVGKLDRMKVAHLAISQTGKLYFLSIINVMC